MTEELLLRYQRARTLDFKLCLKYPTENGTPECIFEEILWILEMPNLSFGPAYIESFCTQLESEYQEHYEKGYEKSYK